MKLKAGAAKREITPPAGMELSGFIARLEPSREVAEPLHVRALLVSSEERTLAIVQADLLGFAPWQVAEVREYARRSLGIPSHALLLSATHTHSGPGLVYVRGCRMAPYKYQWDVVEQIQGALEEACARLAPASLELGVVPYRLGVNRRQETGNGVVLGVASEKPHPQTLAVACLRADNQLIILFSHACHPYIMGGDSLYVSGDFPSLACFELEQEAGTIGFFLNGCAGNIAPLAAFQGIEKAREEGKRLATAVHNGLKEAVGDDSSTIAATTALVHLPYLPLPSDEEIDLIVKKEERVVRPEEKRNREIQRKIGEALAGWGSQMKGVVRGSAPLLPVQCEIQALRIGRLALLGISGEPFYEIGEVLRAQGRLPTVWPLGYTNAYCGYIPTQEEYPRGGYEVDDSWKYVGAWKVDETCERRVLESGKGVLSKLTLDPGLS
jgi:hypothetical protein